MTRARTEELGLELMSRNNGTRHETAFTVSIEARDGVTTGISAADRACTIAAVLMEELRDYGVGAMILELGVERMILLTNTHHTLVGVDGYGLSIVGERRIDEPAPRRARMPDIPASRAVANAEGG